MRKFLVFDLGETLLDFRKKGKWYDSLKIDVIPRMFQVLNQLCEDFRHARFELDYFSEIVYPIIAKQTAVEKTLSMVKRVKEYFRILKIPNKKALINSQLEAFYSTIEPTTVIYPDTKESLATLKIQGYKLGIFSDTPWQCPGCLIDRLVQKFGIADYFSIRKYSGDLELSKPNPEVLQRIMEESNENMQNMVYIGNAERDIDVAANFGIPSIWINRMGQAELPTKNRPYLIVKDLYDLIAHLPIQDKN